MSSFSVAWRRSRWREWVGEGAEGDGEKLIGA